MINMKNNELKCVNFTKNDKYVHTINNLAK